MKAKPARFIFAVVCVILAILLLAQLITVIVGALIFAVALAIFGSISKGFRRK
jgi:hypothetical protein